MRNSLIVDIIFLLPQLFPSNIFYYQYFHNISYKIIVSINFNVISMNNIKSFLNISSNCGGDKNDRKTITDYRLYPVNKSAVSWSLHKQHTVATSSTNAEYMALSDAAITRSQLYSKPLLQLPP